MSTEYNATIELDTRDDVDEHLLDALADYHPATGRGPFGHVQVIITLPAAGLGQAASTALAVVAAVTSASARALEVITAAEFDRRNGTRPMPELVSVSQAAEIAGVSRQAILQRLETGSLAGTRVGNAWVVRRDFITGPAVTARILDTGE